MERRAQRRRGGCQRFHAGHCARSVVNRGGDGESTRALARLLLAGLALNALLVLPAWWRDGQVGSVWIAPEAWLLPAAAVLLPFGGLGRAIRLLVAGGLALVIVAGIFDGLVRSVLGRPLNVFVDIVMLRPGFELIDGSVGRWAALGASLLVGLGAAGVVWAVWRLLGLGTGSSMRPALALCVAAVIAGVPPVALRLPGVAPQMPAMVAQQAEQFQQTRRARRELLAAEDDPAFTARELPGLAGRDVYIVFIESYGASALDQARYGKRMAALLERWGERLAAAGLTAVSGRVAAPIRGGQSWLSHATVLSGLVIDSQFWYRMLLARDIDLLTDDFRATGHVALNLVPAIVDDWPEGRQLGFDRIYAAADMGYAGPSLGWATMPDEFTLHAFSERFRPRFDRPVFAQIALISSHWPWTPVIEPTPDPARIGSGSVYERWRGVGDDPLALLFDPPARREAYFDSLRYSLTVTLDWARRLPDDALLVVLGDHQPASLVAGRDAGRAVPVHVISGDPGLLRGFARRGFVPGLIPARPDQVAGMEALRHWLRASFRAPADLP